MHVKTKQMAFLGIMAALSVLLLLLGNLIEINTLFFMAAASFLVGIAIREYGLAAGVVFFAVCLVAGEIFLPNKLYGITYAGMGLYVWLNEAAYRLLSAKKENGHPRKVIFWVVKIIIFNCIYLPILFLFPELIIGKSLEGIWLLGSIVGGQLVFLVYDFAYEWFQVHIWSGYSKRFRQYMK